jgi:uncharacterized protein YggE
MGDRTITMDATVCRETTPELATVEAKVKAEGDRATAALAQARDRVATVRDSVTEVSADNIQTVDLQVADSTEPFGPDIDARYQATGRLRLTCVPETAESVVVDVTDAGGTVETVHFQIHDQVRRQLQDEALTAAMERARQKADRLAAVENLAVAQVQRVTAQDVDGATGMDRIVEDALDAPDADLSPTPIAVSERVEVVYELTEG